MGEKKVYAGKEGEKAGRELQRQLKQQASQTIRNDGFDPRDCEDQSTVSIGR